MNTKTSHGSDPLLIAQLRAELAASQVTIRELEAQRDAFRAAYERTRLELELLKRKIFVATAERVDTTQLELEFKEKLQALEALAGTLDMPPDPDPDEPGSPARKQKPRGRRELRELGLDEDRIELTDEVFEGLVASGKAKRIGFEESAKLAWKRGGMRLLVIARVKYQAIDSTGESVVETTPLPPEAFPRCLAAPSLLAYVAVAKHCDGLPLARLEGILARGGVGVDRGSMGRWVEDIGGTVGATIVWAMRRDAMCTAFCVATDATSVRIQPDRVAGTNLRRPCRRGHFFVQIADRDHILFTYAERETSEVVLKMFRSYEGYVQADAKSVFDVLFRTKGKKAEDDEPRTEVGCWAHSRRKYWEAALAKFAVAREALARISRIFELDAGWKDRPPSEIRHLRHLHLRPHVEAFLAWDSLRQKDPGYAPVLNLPPAAAQIAVLAAMASLLAFFGWTTRRPYEAQKDPMWLRDSSALLIIALLLSPVTWIQHLVWLVPALYLIAMDSRSKEGLSPPAKFAIALYVLLAVVLNYELLGRKNFSLFLTIHPFAIGMLLLLGILLFDRRHAKAGSCSSNEQDNRVIAP